MSKSMDAPVLTQSASGTHYDVVIMGAGPYGLSTAAHLLGQGLNVAIFGKPMELWRDFMPKGMLLRSYWWATNLSDPQNKFGLERYLNEQGQETFDPVPGDTIADYGLWFQKHAVPNVDETFIQTIERKGEQFEVTLVDGRVITCTSVVMAPGLQPYVYRAPEYDHLPKELVSHTAIHRTFDELAGKKVAMIGGGQSAMESSALAYESGVQVEILSRKALIWIKEGAAFPTNRTLINRIIEPKAGIAPGWFNRIEETFPYSFQRLPRSTKDRLLSGVGSHGPKGSSWLRPRLIGKVPLHEETSVLQAKETDGGIQLTLSTNQTLQVDHIILATGYRVDIKRLTMLGNSLLPQIRDYKGSPILSNHFETSVPGLYFVGFSSHNSCGPYYRFVVGVGAAARRITEAATQRARAGKRS
ncbi:MAG TPA: NAD(P)-binding domain-containing protein [Ktedonobacteraceae bacterium]|nr:NAD(P)-binding domain-containing protein [Ktedonobacteraceae bacterium]